LVITPAINLDLCYVFEKRHPPGCSLRAHPDANLNPNIAWKDYPTGKAIVKIKGPKAFIDIKSRLNKTTGLLVPLAHNPGRVTEEYSTWQRFPTSRSNHTSQDSRHGS